MAKKTPRDKTLLIFVFIVIGIASMIVYDLMNNGGVTTQKRKAEVAVTTIPTPRKESQLDKIKINLPDGYKKEEEMQNVIRISRISSEPSGGPSNFIQIAFVPATDGKINETTSFFTHEQFEILKNIPVGQSQPIIENPDMQQYQTYTRLPNETIDNIDAQKYSNNTLWEFPTGTREVLYYVLHPQGIYFIRGFIEADPNANFLITEEEFNAIVTSIQF